MGAKIKNGNRFHDFRLAIENKFLLLHEELMLYNKPLSLCFSASR
jgi:hypothetical protein